MLKSLLKTPGAHEGRDRAASLRRITCGGRLVRLGASVLVLAFACAPALAQHAWAMRNATAARTGQSTYPGATGGVLDWKFYIAGWANNFAVAQDGSIYLGNVFNQESWSNENYLYALTSAGELKWRVKVKPYNWGASQAIQGSPALDGAGDVVTPSTYTQLIKFSSDGDPLWTFQGHWNTISNPSPAVLPDNSIRHTISPAGLLGLSNYGTALLTGPGNSSGTVAVSPNGEMAIGGIRSIEPHGSLDLQYFNADGTLRWDKWSTYGAQGTPLFGPDGVLYAPFLAKAYRPNGTVKWTTSVSAGSAALSSTGVLYFPSGGVVAVSAASGAVQWTVAIPGGVLGEPAIDSSGNVFVTTSAGRLWSVSPGGTVNWSLQVCEQFLTSPVIGTTGNVIACGKQGYKFFVFSIK